MAKARSKDRRKAQGKDERPAVRRVPATLLTRPGPNKAVRHPGTCDVVVEAPLNIEVAGLGNYLLMGSPTDVEALAAGFLLSEGIIRRREDILDIQAWPGGATAARVRLAHPPKAPRGTRNLMVVSSCGLCGAGSLDDFFHGLAPVGQTLVLPAESLNRAMVSLHERQRIFPLTGGTHAAGLFGPEGEILVFAEDIGRHNALDKVLGKCLLQGIPLAGRAAALSGRVSVELVLKSARAGLELVAAISAPTHLAVDTAQRLNLTLCGFVREGRATVFTCPGRLR